MNRSIQEAIINTRIDASTINLLLPFQVEHLQHLIYCINKYNICLDASDTGTGKTYTNMALVKQLQFKPFIVCPKSVISAWQDVANQFNVQPLAIVNYETLRNGKYYENNKRVMCPYVTKEKKKREYAWNFPKKTLVIFDEAHKSKNMKTANNKMLLSLKSYLTSSVKLSLLSASISDKRIAIKYIAYMLGLYDTSGNDKTSYRQWVVALKNSARKEIDNEFLSKSTSIPQSEHKKLMQKIVDSHLFSKIYSMIFPERGSRMRIKQIKKMYSNRFNSSLIHPQCFAMEQENVDAINTQYKRIQQAIQNIKNKTITETHPLTVILRARQEIELLKIPAIINVAKSFLSTGYYSIVIFVNFTKTIKILGKKLTHIWKNFGKVYFDFLPMEINMKIHSYLAKPQFLYGDQTAEERQEIINAFQQGLSRLIIANISVGSVGLSLHDVTGVHPRVSIINTSFSAIDLLQTLGRTCRAGANSDSLQFIVYCDGTIENKICSNIQHKMCNISLLNDNDITGYDVNLVKT